MPDIDPGRLLPIVTGVQLNAELGDRPLAYRLEAQVKTLIEQILGRSTPGGGPPRLAPVVVSDVYYLNSDPLQARPTLSVGGPGVNALSALLVNELPTVAAIENVLVVQMDLDMKDPRVAVWGMDHLDTVRAVELFASKGYLETFVRGAIERTEEDDGEVAEDDEEEAE